MHRERRFDLPCIAASVARTAWLSLVLGDDSRYMEQALWKTTRVLNEGGWSDSHGAQGVSGSSGTRACANAAHKAVHVAEPSVLYTLMTSPLLFFSAAAIAAWFI